MVNAVAADTVVIAIVEIRTDISAGYIMKCIIQRSFFEDLYRSS